MLSFAGMIHPGLPVGKKNKLNQVHTAPDWSSARDIVNNLSIDSKKSFHLHISREENGELVIRLNLSVDINANIIKANSKTPIRTPAGVFDLSW